jgi:hypothetical protein
MNKIIDSELSRFSVIKDLDEINLNRIVQEYNNLTYDEQATLSFLWTIEEIIHKN